MQKFDENILRSMSRGLNINAISSVANMFLEDVNSLTSQILDAMKRVDLNYDISFFGAYDRGDIVSEKEHISLAIILKDEEIYEETNQIGKYRTKHKRNKNSKLEEFKMLLIMMLQRYFNHKVNISLQNNAIIIDSYKFYNQNFKIYVFTQSYTRKELLTISSTDLKSCYFNLEDYTKNFNKKNELTDYNYSKICNIFKTLAMDLGISNDVLLIETYFYNIPNELFVGYLNEQIFKILNEYMFVSKTSFRSIGSNINIVNDKFLINNNYFKANQIIAKINHIFR